MYASYKKDYLPHKVLDMKQQEGQTLILIQWLNTPIEQATWEVEQKICSFHPQINSLIEEYVKSRAMDKGFNFLVKNAQRTQEGESPYYETTRHGHFLYGDQIDEVQSVRIYQAPKKDDPVTVLLEIKWKARMEIDEEDGNKKTMVILENSFMDTGTIAEYEPEFMAKFYESKISLSYSERKY